MRRITPAIRREAALICAIAASNEDESIGSACVELDYADHAHVGGYIRELALAAQAAACRRIGWPAVRREGYGVTYAEAEALLRTGWTPEGWTT